jgi:hypothetical protein
MASVAEQLNNAIYSLASLNPGVAAATNLNENWQAWFANNRGGTLVSPAYWAALKGYWAAYAAARIASPMLNTRTPPAGDIDPTLYKTFGGGVDQQTELLKDAGAATADALEEAASELGKYGRPVLFVVGLVAIAMILSKVGGR